MIRHDSGSGSSSTVSKEDVPHVLSEEEEESFTPECQLGLSLTLAVGDGNSGGYMVSKPQRSAPKILTADEFKSVVSAASPSSSSSSSSSTQNRVNGTAGTKRAADCVSPSNAASQVVGWPPIRSYRMNNMANNGKASLNKTFILTNEKRNAIAAAALEKDNDLRNHEESNRKQRLSLKSLFVKVNMDGVAIGRKVDLSALNCYQTLAQTLDAMFSAPSQNANSYATTRGLKLLDGSSGYSLTYEDKDGDWMLAGDVPWSMFLNTVKRLRIMRSRNTIQ